MNRGRWNYKTNGIEINSGDDFLIWMDRTKKIFRLILNVYTLELTFTITVSTRHHLIDNS